MPIGFDPNDTATFSLDYDVATYQDEKTRPKFHVPFLTSRDALKTLAKAKELFAQYDKETDADKRPDILVEAAKLYITHWENMPEHPVHGPLTWENMAQCFTLTTLDELTEKMLSASRLTEIERGKSASAPASGGAAPVPSATPASA